MSTLKLSPAASISKNEQGLLLQSDLGTFQLHGRDVEAFVSNVIPLLNGEHSLESLCQALKDYDKESIASLIGTLMNQGIVVKQDELTVSQPPWPSQQRFLQAWNTADKKELSSLASAHVLVIGLEPWSVHLVDELARTGVGHIHLVDGSSLSLDDQINHSAFLPEDIDSPRTTVVAERIGALAPWCNLTSEPFATDEKGHVVINYTTDYAFDLAIVTLGPEALYHSQQVSLSLQQQPVPTLFGTIDGLESWIGPVVKAGQPGCWNCMRLRRLGASDNPQLSHVLEQSTLDSRENSRSRSLLGGMAPMHGHGLAMEALKLLLNYTTSDIHSRVNVHNLVTGESRKHRIIPVPWCDVCGGTPYQPHHFHDQKPSGHRPQPAANPLNSINTVKELKQLFDGWLDPVTGIIRQLNDHLHTLPDFPVTASASVSTFTQGTFDPRGMGQVGSGKGLDAVSAHISAIGEALERYSAARYQKDQLKYAAISQLTGEYLDPDDLVLYSKKQYASEGFPFAPWKRKRSVHWARGYWVGTTTPVWVPALVTYFNFQCRYEEQFSQVSSNGLAAGQNHDDAALRACYELIERDAMMLTWYAQQPCQRLNIDSLYEGKMRLLIDELHQRGVELELYLLDVGLHVPTVVCLSLGDGISTPAASVALSCHGDIRVAARKALLEQGHVMPYLCYLMSTGQSFPRQADDVRSLEDHAAYYFAKDKQSCFDFMRQDADKAIDPEDWTYPVINNVSDLKERLADTGVEIAVVDVTAPDVSLTPFKVARAVGRHLQPIHFGEQFRRFNNPRLRRLLKGAAVNPHPHPIA
ncbi:TOMM precursor leader peptide-binding protein [Endozoicomonas lisbonensis]|uniref:Ribosomal protein S12 methylthiotransferase accessory factor n=1 Tax=Endozoicomonas lisbonensis TaxID=3120522 RepID=A0ABV2SAZ9_9GAMM